MYGSAMRVLTGPQIRAAVPMETAIAAMRSAFAQRALEEVEAPLRTVLTTPHGHLLVMPAWLGGSGDLAVKLVSVVPGNPERGLPRVLGLVALFDPVTGSPRAVLHGATVTALRTAAVTGLATDLLARPDARTLAIVGAGALAADQIAAVCSVRSIAEVRVYAPTHSHAQAACRGVRNARATATVAEAIRGADIVVTVTTSVDPVFDDADLAPGAHIVAVGAWRPELCEIPSVTVRRARVFVDDRVAATTESGDLIRAGVGPGDVAGDLAELVLARAAGRTSDAELTLFESVGLAIEDAALAGAVVEVAEQKGIGTVADFGDSPRPELVGARQSGDHP